MPPQARVLGERDGCRGRRERQARPQRAVAGIVRGKEHRERVRAAVEEDGDEDLAGTAGGHGALDALLERARDDRRGAVDRQREAEAAGDEAAPVEARARWSRHSGLDGGQAVAGERDAAPKRLGTGVLVAATHQAAW